MNDFISSLRLLHKVVVLLAATVKEIAAGNCQPGSVTSLRYSDTIVNHTIVGPVLSNITAMNERECEKACHLALPPDLCYMFNYHPSSKVCELLYKDRATEYKVEKKKESTFKTRKCDVNPCNERQHCYSLSDQTNNSCVCRPTYEGNYCQFGQKGIRLNVLKVCTGAQNDRPGRFFVPHPGKIKTFRLVHISGGVKHWKGPSKQGRWGTKESPYSIELHITDNQDARITPPIGYPINGHRMWYKIPGYNSMSQELLFPEISPPINVTAGKEFRVWFGEDLQDHSEVNNGGSTCYQVYIYYVP